MAGHEGNPDALRQWFEDGADGQIDWGSPGDFDACVAIAGKYMDDAEGYCNLRHQGAVGGPPGSEGKRMSDIVYKQIRAETKIDADGVITATLSTEAEDRDGDIIRASAWQLDHFNKHPVLISDHNYAIRSVVGEWKNVHVKGDRLVGEPHFFAGKGNPDADWGYELAKMGKAAFSVGFVPIEDEPRGKGVGGREYKQVELLECSIVAIPSNREALQLAAKSVKAGPVADIVNELLTEEPRRKDGPAQCAVSGCDDMSSAHVGVCADHLKMLTALQPNPTTYGRSFDPDADAFDYAVKVLRGWAMRSFKIKAGAQISGSNLGKIHTALDALHALHDPNCKDDSCEFGGAPDDDSTPDDGSGDGAASDGDKALLALYTTRAMGEGSGAAGGVTVNPETGTHGAVDGDTTHSHPHAANGFQGEDGLHNHEPHDHPDGTADHGHSHADATVKAPQSTADQNDLPDSAFAAILPGGSKDADGKTIPRSLRKLPHHHADGSLDLPHLKEQKNALARISQTDMPADLKAKAQAHLDAHAKAEGIGQAAEDSGGSEDKAFDLEAMIEKALEGVSPW
jgi:hypothetical protein